MAQTRVTMETRKAILLADTLRIMDKTSKDFPLSDEVWEEARAAAERVSLMAGGPRMGIPSEPTKERVRCLLVRDESTTVDELFAGLGV